jgi:hypothetical protein
MTLALITRLANEPSGSIAMMIVIAAGVVGLALGRPRAWVIVVNLLLLSLASLAARAAGTPDAASIAAFAIAGVSLIVLALPSVRPWFGQACPACTSLGARPVWSRPRAFGCVRCGSCWTTSESR